jgi:hypothetical protein
MLALVWIVMSTALRIVSVGTNRKLRLQSRRGKPRYLNYGGLAEVNDHRMNLQSWLPKELHPEINPLLVGFGQVGAHSLVDLAS